MTSAGSVTVVLPVYSSAMPARAVLRDLAVAAYALRSRGARLDVLLLTHDVDCLLPEITSLANELGLPVEAVPGPPAGPGAAYVEGFARVAGRPDTDVVVTLDATGRHDPGEIPRLVDRLIDDDLDVVIGSRWTRGSGTPGLEPSRWALGKLANLAFRRLTGTRGIADATTSFRVARIGVVRDFSAPTGAVTSHTVQTAFVAMAVARGYRVGEAPIIYRAAPGIGGGLRLQDALPFASHLLALRHDVDVTRQRRLSPDGRRFDQDRFRAADDLEQLATARHFFEWVLDEFDPYLRGRVLEVGAGAGNITRKLLDRYPGIDLVALEPATNMAEILEPYAAFAPRLTVSRKTLCEYQRTDDGRFDAVLYLNVLEHIADDRTEVALAADRLQPGGALLVFGPAHEWLYSDLDHKAGHYRRYTVDGLRGLALDAGLRVETIRYFDVLGVPPYFLVYRGLRQTEISGSTMWGYDRMVVPTSRLIQRVIPRPPVGKNVIMVAVKP